jgi:hypothetical protein
VGGALVEVRRAYRLLHAYHQRVYDLFQVTDTYLSGQGLAFESWGPLNVARLPRSKTPFFKTTWAWDMTPAYQIECQWEGTSHKHRCKVHVHAIADTGYDASCEGEPDPSQFKEVEETVSQLRVGMYRTRAKKPDWDAAWELLSRIKNRKDGADHTVSVRGDDYTHRYFDLNLADLADKPAVEARLLLPLGRWLAGA